jgi:sulfate/thiosulfate transport system permease protein
MSGWIRIGLISIVIAYVGLLIVAPLTALVSGAFSQGFNAVAASILKPEFVLAFWRTLWIALLVVFIHVGFGTAVAWVMVRHHFPGRELLNGLIDMPFAIS